MHEKMLTAGALTLGALGVASSAEVPARPSIERQSVLNVSVAEPQQSRSLYGPLRSRAG